MARSPLWQSLVALLVACQPPPLDPFDVEDDTGDETSDDAAPCGPCGSGRQIGDDCTGSLATPVQDLVANAGSIMASTVFDNDVAQFGPELARDQDSTTSWFSAGPVNGSSTLEWTSPREDCISEVRIRNNDDHVEPSFRTGFGFSEATVRLFGKGSSTAAFEAVVDLTGTPDPDVDLVVAAQTEGVFASRLQIVFSGHEDPSCGGVSEIGVSAWFE